MNAPRVRGICPGLSVPMPTGDGLLVRLRPTAPVPLDAMVGFCEAARRHGNGVIEISARGSLQVRGLTPRSAPLLASALAELGIATQERVPVITGFELIRADLLPSPLWGGVGGGGREMRRFGAPRPDPPPQPSPTRGEGAADVAGELRQAIAKAQLALSPKVSIVVDGGGPLHLDALSADIRLRAAAPAQGRRFCSPRFYLGLGGDGASATWLGSVAPGDVVGAVLGILTIIGAHGPTVRTAAVLRAEGIEAFRSVSALAEPSPAPPQRRPAEMVGVHRAYEGTLAVGIGLVFGHAHADALAELVRLAARHGGNAAWPIPDRALLLTGISAPDALSLTAAAEQLGFVVQAGDLRRRIAACPGAPACASGLIPARALASALTPILEPALRPVRNGVVVHISGCPKGCAHPIAAALTLVGTPDGCGIIHHGSARTAPGRYVDPASLGDELSRIAAESKEAAYA